MKMLRSAIAIWGLLGVMSLLGQAIYKLTPMAIEPLGPDMSWWVAVCYVLCVVFMLYSEGYKGFHLNFAPRVVGRAAWLTDPGNTPRLHWLIFAPFFLMGLIGSNRRRTIIQWVLVSAIIVAVMVVRQLSQPWRGVVDAGVVAGLGLGCMSIFFYLVRSLSGSPPGIEKLDLPPAYVPEGSGQEPADVAA